MTLPLPVIPNTFRCTLNWRDSFTNQTAKNVIHIQNSGATLAASDAYAALNANVTTGMWLPVISTAAVETVSIIKLDGATASVDFVTGRPAKWSGTPTGDFIPGYCGLIKVTTALRGRRHRGRVYLPFLPEGSLSDGALFTGAPATTTTAWQNFATALEGMTPAWAFGVATYGRPDPANPAGWAPAFTPVDQVICEPIAAIQRRRQSRLR